MSSVTDLCLSDGPLGLNAFFESHLHLNLLVYDRNLIFHGQAVDILLYFIPRDQAFVVQTNPNLPIMDYDLPSVN